MDIKHQKIFHHKIETMMKYEKISKLINKLQIFVLIIKYF